MDDNALERPVTATAARWNIVSVALPAVAIAIGLLWLAASPRATGDWFGGLGAAVLFALGIGAACVGGEIAALIALARGERLLWLTIIGIVGNGAVILPLLGLFFGG